MKHSSLLAALLLACPFAQAAESEPHVVMNSRHRALLQEYCEKCHGAEKQKGKFRIDQLSFNIDNLETAEKWQKVLNQMNSGDMPPEEEKQPLRQAKADLLDDLANTMVAARRVLGDQHGVITMRRLNRREYRNTLRELLGVDVNVTELPSDTGTGGFDTVGVNLFMSGNQFEQYQALGRDAVEEAFAAQTAAGVEKKLRYEVEDTLKTITKNYQDKLDALRRAELWVKAVEAAAVRPENAAVVAEIRRGSKDEAIFRRSWKKIAGAPAPEEFGFNTPENNADKANGALSYGTTTGNGYMRPYHEYYLHLPHLDTGAYLTISGGTDMGNDNLSLLVPYNWPVGDYVLRVCIAATDHAAPGRRFMEFGIHPRNGQVLSTHEVTGTMASPQIIEIPFTLTRSNADGGNRTLFIREKGTADHYTQTRARFAEGRKQNGIGPEVALWVDWMEIERQPGKKGELPPGLRALGIPFDDKAQPPARAELRGALERFAREAFRGTPPPTTYLDRLVDLYELRRKAGDKHSVALKETLSLVLASPMFLYLAEPVADGQRRALNASELAIRLSYFLWGEPPDVTLQDLAGRGELARPEVLAAQTDRLLDDPHANDFVRAFLSQWLNMDRLDFFQVNRALYPRFDDSTKLAARNEMFETFAYVLRQRTSLRDLVKSDYVIINSVLANYYDIAGVKGDEFRKVPVPKGSPRGGLLGMAAVMAMGGNGERTSPVERGAWVLRKILNDPPPPAPANVPQIARLAGRVLTTRERLQAHQEDAQCASCHRKIDPIGFGLENFDTVGQWRTEDSYQLTDANGKPDPKSRKTWTIDAGATFHRGPSFRDYFEMRDIISAKSDAFARGFSVELIEYALGRSIGFRDEPLIAEMMQRAGRKDLAAREFIQALVASKEFHTK